MKAAGALILAALLAVSCGYSIGPVAPGAGGRTIAVPAFENTTYRRDLERDLTRAVREEILARSDCRLVEISDHPDLVLTGTLVEVDERVLSESEGGELRESSVAVTAMVTLSDTRTGELLLDRSRLTEREPFVPAKGGSIRTAENAALRTLAERIVYSLSPGW